MSVKGVLQYFYFHNCYTDSNVITIITSSCTAVIIVQNAQWTSGNRTYLEYLGLITTPNNEENNNRKIKTITSMEALWGI